MFDWLWMDLQEKEIIERLPKDWKEYSHNKIRYVNTPISFDIETTSFYDHGEKRAIMYLWAVCVGLDMVIMGRTWDDFYNLIELLMEHFQVSPNKRLAIYVHNLAYEFSFMAMRFDWERVFAIRNRTPINAVTFDGIEFRCSYLLSGMSLAKVGENLRTYKVEKLVGALDYSKERHETTPLTDLELCYMENDVKVVTAYIQEKLDNGEKISNIPMTKTSYVRIACRKAVYGKGHNDKGYINYRALMEQLTMSPKEYQFLKSAFQGGFTHANAYYYGKVSNNVTSLDETSAYPTMMVAYKFPMFKGKYFKNMSCKEWMQKKDLYCFCVEVEFFNIKSKIHFEHYISESRCLQLWNGEKDGKKLRCDIDNGRIVSAKYCRMIITEQDFYIISRFYSFEKFRIVQGYQYKRGYLPTDFIKSVLGFYADKTTLKGVEGKEVEYLVGKENLNSTYGMCVTDPIKGLIEFIPQGDTVNWESTPPDVNEKIKEYNEKKNRFLFYAWGVWVTAYNRRTLADAILECKDDYIYSDTDSVKILNYERHKKYFDDYNAVIRCKLKSACDYHNFSYDMIEPMNAKGERKPLGVWDYEGTYDKFKTLGAKRYLTEEKGQLHLTVAGLNKKKAVEYLKKRDNPFDAFCEGLEVPSDYAGRQVATYIDYPYCGEVTDYFGNTSTYFEKSGVHLENSTYEMSLGRAYADWLAKINVL